jgi:uncharacterized protein (TIGR00251 family)
MGSDPVRTTADGVIVSVRVIPRASRTAIAGTRDGAVLVRLAAPPVEGAANDELVELFARTMKVPRRAVTILSGDRARLKQVSIDGVSADEFRSRCLPTAS